MRTIGIRDALREALHEEMARDDTVFVMGEDVIAHGGPYTVTQGIAEKWPGRIFETPIAEAGIVGLGVGAALAGMRPVVEIMYLDFITCAMDEVVNQAAKMRYMTGGQASVPMVIRLPCGPARLLAAQHSQIMESWFMHVPGLQVVVPTTPYDAKGLMKTAIRSPDPVMFFEYKAMYLHEGGVPDDDYVIPFGVADVKREGEDATVIAIGGMVPRALEAGVALEDEGFDIEVVDPRTLSPLDADAICESVRKTGRGRRLRAGLVVRRQRRGDRRDAGRVVLPRSPRTDCPRRQQARSHALRRGAGEPHRARHRRDLRRRAPGDELMAVQLRLAALGHTMERGKVVEWYVSEGGAVVEGTPLFAVETDKAVVDVESPAGGVLLRIDAPADREYPVGATLAWIGDAGESLPDRADETIAAPGGGRRRSARHAGRPPSCRTPRRGCGS